YWAEMRAPGGYAQTGSAEKPLELPVAGADVALLAVAPAPRAHKKSVLKSWWLWATGGAGAATGVGVGGDLGRGPGPTPAARRGLDLPGAMMKRVLVLWLLAGCGAPAAAPSVKMSMDAASGLSASQVGSVEILVIGGDGPTCKRALSPHSPLDDPELEVFMH